MRVLIEDFHDYKSQTCRMGRHVWSVARLIELARELEVMDVPLVHLNIYQQYEKITLRQMVTHFKAVQAVDMTKPIILDEDGDLMDGRHRIMRALLDGNETIKAVRFEKNPNPCRVEEDE